MWKDNQTPGQNGEGSQFLLAVHMLPEIIGVPCFLATPNGLRLEEVLLTVRAMVVS